MWLQMLPFSGYWHHYQLPFKTCLKCLEILLLRRGDLCEDIEIQLRKSLKAWSCGFYLCGFFYWTQWLLTMRVARIWLRTSFSPKEGRVGVFIALSRPFTCKSFLFLSLVLARATKQLRVVRCVSVLQPVIVDDNLDEDVHHPGSVGFAEQDRSAKAGLLDLGGGRNPNLRLSHVAPFFFPYLKSPSWCYSYDNQPTPPVSLPPIPPHAVSLLVSREEHPLTRAGTKRHR